MKLYLDTNVILDMLDPGRPEADSTAILFDLARKRRLELLVSTQSIIDTYYIGGHMGIAKDVMDRLMKWILDYLNVRAIDSIDMRQAMNMVFPDIEDNAQIAMADNAGCDFFITKDMEVLTQHTESLCVFTTPGGFIKRLT